MIELKNINKYYQSSEGKFHALNDINLTLPDKGMVYIVGKSGSGKSTLLNVIGGIDKYDSGSLIISNLNEENGQKIKSQLNTASFTRKDYNAFRNTYIGFIFQEFNVIKGLTVYENVALSLDLQRLPINENQILEILEKVGLKGKEKRRINELSGGERQRVAIARALIKNPMVIIADEPTGNLDAKNRDIVMDILKNLSKDKLVLIVTHDKYLASRYGDREITIKDGQIINDKTYHNENLITGVVSTYNLKPIYPKSIVSLKLAWSNFKLNKLRFILIILLFSVSLIFAGAVVNLYLADTTKEYANYQKEYGNNVVSLSNKYTYHDNTSSTGFFAYDLQVAKNEFKIDETASMTTYTSMPINIPITNSTNPSQFTNKNNFYSENISNITIYDSVSQLQANFLGLNENEAIKYNDYYCYVTDYLVMSMLYSNFYNTPVTAANITGKYLEIAGLNKRIYIAGVITTNYLEFANLNENDELLSDTKKYAAFSDNLAIYNSIFISKETYTNLFNKKNLDYYIDDVLYLNKDNTTTKYDDVKFSYSKPNLIYLKGNKPTKPKQGELTQVAVSKGYLEQVIGIELDNAIFVNESNTKLSYNGTTSYNFYICGIERIPAPMEFNITGIVNSDELIVYAPNPSEYELYDSWISSSFQEGGFLTAVISDDVNANSKVYRNLLNNEITINNPSFLKLQLVDDFVNDNLFLFAVLFFSFGLFSILMIFNFIIITIKNSTRDIGIYMSLGMNGLKISLIYLFQVIIISTISIIIGSIGSSILINQIDNSFSLQALIDFKILKNTALGYIISIIIAYLTPFIAIASPLLSLSRKKPIDVIKAA